MAKYIRRTATFFHFDDLELAKKLAPPEDAAMAALVPCQLVAPRNPKGATASG